MEGDRILKKDLSILSKRQLRQTMCHCTQPSHTQETLCPYLDSIQVRLGKQKKTALRLSKKSVGHMAFLGLIGAVVWQSQLPGGVHRYSLFYSLVSGEEIVEGPLDPSAYAQTNEVGVGGARIAAASASDANFITFDDPEVTFAQTLGGSAVVAPLSPLVPEPGTNEEGGNTTESSSSKKPEVYTVQEGDTIASIAAKFDISVNTILWANGLRSQNVIKTGDHLTILPTTGVLHTVQSGDTISGIAGKYEVKVSEIAAYNSLGDGSRLSIGQKVVVPDGYIKPTIEQSAPQIVSKDTRLAREEEEGPTPEPAEVPANGKGFVWPTTTNHISQYFRWGHTGVDIDNRSRPSVFAAQSGTVEFTGWLGGYGNLIIVNHGGGLTTYYAHLDKFYVSKGQAVTTGAAIGKMGSTGRSTGPHVHFEVRRNGRPINPMGMY